MTLAEARSAALDIADGMAEWEVQRDTTGQPRVFLRDGRWITVLKRPSTASDAGRAAFNGNNDLAKRILRGVFTREEPKALAYLDPPGPGKPVVVTREHDLGPA